MFKRHDIFENKKFAYSFRGKSILKTNCFEIFPLKFSFFFYLIHRSTFWLQELAGRIQQLQLLGKDMRTDVRDKLWRQLESEILLHRHKTVIRACRNRPHLDLLRPVRHLANIHTNGGTKEDHVNGNAKGGGVSGNDEEPPGMVGEKRLVVVRRQEGQGLGISITVS